MQRSHLSVGEAPTLNPTEMEFHIRLESVSSTPFGAPLEPEV